MPSLALLDTNHDNKITAADTGCNTINVWQDLNSNGKTDAGELKTLAQLSITSLSLQTSTTSYLAGHNVAVNDNEKYG